MKLADRHTVEMLAQRREKLMLALEFTAPDYKGNGFAVMIQSVYQNQDLVDRLRPAAHAIFTEQLNKLDASLAKFGVEP